MRFPLLFRLNLILALTAIEGIPAQQRHVPDCCTSKTVKLSPRQVKSRLLKTESSTPFAPFALGHDVHIDTTVVLATAVDVAGTVSSLEVISGHPMAVQAALALVKQWTLRPYKLHGRPNSFCGRVAVRIRGTEYTAKYDVVLAPPN